MSKPLTCFLFKMNFNFLSSAAPNEYCVAKTTLTGTSTNFMDHFVMTVGPGNPNTVTWYVDGQFDVDKSTVGFSQGNLQAAELWPVSAILQPCLRPFLTLVLYYSIGTGTTSCSSSATLRTSPSCRGRRALCPGTVSTTLQPLTHIL